MAAASARAVVGVVNEENTKILSVSPNEIRSADGGGDESQQPSCDDDDKTDKSNVANDVEDGDVAASNDKADDDQSNALKSLRNNSKSNSSRNSSNIKQGYNNIIASLLRTTTL